MSTKLEIFSRIKKNGYEDRTWQKQTATNWSSWRVRILILNVPSNLLDSTALRSLDRTTEIILRATNYGSSIFCMWTLCEHCECVSRRVCILRSPGQTPKHRVIAEPCFFCKYQRPLHHNQKHKRTPALNSIKFICTCGRRMWRLRMQMWVSKVRPAVTATMSSTWPLQCRSSIQAKRTCASSLRMQYAVCSMIA